MGKILEDLYYGEILDKVKYVKKDTSYDKIFRHMVDLEEKPGEKLTDEDKMKFFKYVDAAMRVNGETATLNFVEGFKPGAKITYESFVEE